MFLAQRSLSGENNNSPNLTFEPIKNIIHLVIKYCGVDSKPAFDIRIESIQ